PCPYTTLFRSTAGGAARRATGGARWVRPIARVARAGLFGAVVAEAALVDPLVGVRVADVGDVPVRGVERRAAGPQEEVDEPDAGGVERVGDRHRLPVARAGRRQRAERRLRARIARHEDDLVVVVERAGRIRLRLG